MKRNIVRNRSMSQPSVAWREDQYAALQARVEQRYEDRVSDNIFDLEDERAEVDSIVHGRMYDAN